MSRAGFLFYVAEMEVKRTSGFRRFRTACLWIPAYAGMTSGAYAGMTRVGIPAHTPHVVTRANAGDQVDLHCVPLVSHCLPLDSGLRRNDEFVRNDDTA